MKFAILKFK